MQLDVRDIIMTYKSLNDLTLRNVFTTRSDIYEGNTRNKDKLQVPLCRRRTAHRDRAGGGAGGDSAFPPQTFWLIKSQFFFYFSKTGLSFTKSVRYIILCQIYRPLSKFSLFLIGAFRSNLFFFRFVPNRRLDFRLCSNGT